METKIKGANIKHLIKFMMILISTQVLFATESQEIERDIKALIVKIKKADASQKRILINELKLKVQKVNLAKKEQVIGALKRSLKSTPKDTKIHPRSHDIKPMNKEHPPNMMDMKPPADLHKPLPPPPNMNIDPSTDLNRPPPPQ